MNWLLKKLNNVPRWLTVIMDALIILMLAVIIGLLSYAK